MKLNKKQGYRILGVCCVLELAIIQVGCGNAPNTTSQSAVPASARPTAISTPIASPSVRASQIPVSVMSAQPEVLSVPGVTPIVPSPLTSESAPVRPVVSATPTVLSSVAVHSSDAHTTGSTSGSGASRAAAATPSPTPDPTPTTGVLVTPTPLPTPVPTPFPTATPATPASPSGQAPLQFKTASFQYGPDSQFYPLTLTDRGANTIHICDCQPGADTSCVAGQDANPGTANAPQQSILAAVTAFNQGQNIAFCRGGAWESANSLALDASHCRDESPCYIEDYGVSDQALPLITITSQDGQGAFDLDTRDNGTRWAGLRLYNLHLKKATQDGLGSGIFLFRGIDNVEMRGLDIEGFGIGVALNANGLATSGIVLADSYLHDNGVMGWLGGTDQTLIERNRFHNNGHYQASMFHHNLYFSDKANQSVIRQNWISGSALDASGRCLGTSVVAHSGTTEDLRIEYNLIEESQPTGGCWGLTVDASGSNPESHHNAIIRGNLVRDVGNIAIGVASCVDCLIEDNVVIQTQIGGSVGIAAPNRPTQAPDADNTRTTVRNNTVYFAGQGNGRHYYVGERGSNHVVTNNVGYSANPQPGDSCFDFDLPASAYRLVSHNLCFGPAFDSGTTGMDSAAVLADPLFRQAPEDLRLQAQSPARDSARADEASVQDFDGSGRDASPDRGAFEF